MQSEHRTPIVAVWYGHGAVQRKIARGVFAQEQEAGAARRDQKTRARRTERDTHALPTHSSWYLVRDTRTSFQAAAHEHLLSGARPQTREEPVLALALALRRLVL